jgi:CheY-like chemotaxis protein
VDNDAEMVTLLQRHLEHEGWNVVAVTSGPEGLARLQRDDFAVILTDLVMDDVDGLTILAETRVLLMTAFGSLETGPRGSRAALRLRDLAGAVARHADGLRTGRVGRRQ